MTQNPHIIIVDDEAPAREMVGDYLKMHGFNVTLCDGGKSLRGAIESGVPDLVVLDLNMPEEDGLSIIRDLKSRTNVPVIMLTATASPIGRVVGLELGADDYVAKPSELRELMARIRELVDREATAYGIQVVDVRIRRADLPEQNSQAVYQRMQTERQQEAAQLRAQGTQRAQEIRAKADREVTVLLADAQSKGEQTRGEGDGERNRIFAEAYGKDPDFFSFYRSMQAYEAGMRPNDTRMLLKPDSEFFRYFVDPSGKVREGATPPGTMPPPSSPAK